MTSAGTQPAAAPPDDPMRVALGNSEVRTGLREHAQSSLRRWLGDRPAAVRDEMADEAVQETELRALQKLHEFHSDGSAPAWLHGIMNYVLLEPCTNCRYRSQWTL